MKITRATSHLGSLLLLALGLAGCGKGNGADEATEAAKKAHAAAITALKQPVALIAVYAPYAKYPEGTDKYAPQRHSDLDKSTECAANEMRYAANKARQRLEADADGATKDLQAAFKTVTEVLRRRDRAGLAHQVYGRRRRARRVARQDRRRRRRAGRRRQVPARRSPPP